MFLRTLIAIFIGILVVELLLIGAQMISPKTKALTKPTPQPTSSILATPAPLSSPKPPFFTSPIDWKFADTTDTNSLQNTQLLYVEDQPATGVRVTGTEWVSTHENITNERLAEIKDYGSEYFKTLEQLNWNQSIDIKDTSLSGISADGPQGSITGFLKTTNDSLTILVVDEQIVKSESSDNSPIVCPCSYTMKIFMSNPIPLTSLDRYLKEGN